MNEYVKHSIRKFHKLYQQRVFDQDDVALILVLVRDYTAKGGLLRELGDFLAHPDRKDRGLLITEIHRIAALHDEFLTEEYRLRRNGLEYDYTKLPRFHGITRDQLSNELAAVLSFSDVDTRNFDSNSHSFREFVACVILLLEPCQLKVNDQLLRVEVEYGHAITALVKYESQLYRNNFASLPILSLLNVNIHMTRQHECFTLSSVVARRHRSGGLFAISHCNDLVEQFMHRENYERTEKIYALNSV
ncbi:hypothetical protein EV681_0020 [Advenella incenata]|uniref:Uncharacterized protein n=1 Tax=Advenella incenata TaxID=267800 RepID=A0A4Q7VPR2_9BURK|nr:hypothetical protein [Advenella incenata]RZT98244.1 hypothetical protein EV681_0020 [Advenella incenata]